METIKIMDNASKKYPRIDKKEFIKMYCKKSGISWKELKKLGAKAEKCDCDFDGCSGWIMNTQ